MKTGRLHLVQSEAPPPSERAVRPEERDLFNGIRSGSADWQRRAFDEFHGLVFGLLTRSLGPQAEIEDLVSDVFLSFFESAKNVRSADGLRSYIVTIALNTVRREVRQRKRRALLYKLSGTADEIERRPGFDDPKAKAALLQLSRILDQVATEDRIAFVLHSLAGMQLAEIAQVLGVSLSTAKRRVRRATEHVLKRVSRNVLLSDYLREKSERRND